MRMWYLAVLCCGLKFAFGPGGLLLGQEAKPGQIECMGVISISGEATDQSALNDVFENGVPHNRFGGISGIDYDPETDSFWVISDRGPQDGAVDWTCRAHRLKIQLAKIPTSQILETILFRDTQGRRFSGLSHAIQLVSSSAGRFDPEGIRVNGPWLFVSDEYGPHVRKFSRAGELQSELAIPEGYRVDHPHGDEKEENQLNQIGRRTNRGMEGLAFFEGRLAGLMQSPLLQDSFRDTNGKLSGLNCRLLTFDKAGNPAAQFVYRLDQDANKLNEILALDEHRYLVIERDGEAGTAAAFKKIMLIDVDQASDVRGLATLPLELTDSIRPVQKTVFLDLLDPQFGLRGEQFPEKVEGLCWGPNLPDGRKTLVVAVDNDFEGTNPTLFWVFAIPSQG